jgi:hypothetical protein
MTERTISATELHRLMADPEVPDSELRPYLTTDAAGSKAFAPEVRVDLDKVDATRTQSAVFRNTLNGISRWRRQERYLARVAREPRARRLVSEGDSWFQYPFLLEDVIDWLEPDFAVWSLGAAGDLLDDIVRQNEMMEALAERDPEALLLSGGGNDLLGSGRLVAYLAHHQVGMSAADHIEPAFGAFVATVIENFREIFARVAGEFPSLRILCHGYDYAIPDAGKWLGRPMEKREIRDRGLQAAIVRIIVDRFNADLNQLIDDFPAVTYVNCRDVVRDWHDELHPTDSSYELVAGAFSAKL